MKFLRPLKSLPNHSHNPLRFFRLVRNGLALLALYGMGLSACMQPISDLPPSPLEVPASNQSALLRLALIGDTGDPAPQESALNTLLAWTKLSPVRTVIIFLGDTIYDRGLPPPSDPNRAEAEQRLMRQLTMIKHSGAQAIFIPGNHDWAKGSGVGFDRLQAMNAFIHHFLGGGGQVLPKPGCPGPESVDIAPARLIFLDTEWWLENEENKHNPECAIADEASIHTELTRLLAQAKDRFVLVMGHHPIASHGPHGGYASHPLKVFTKWLLPTNQDLGGDNYENMVDELTSAFSQYPPLVYASGHDHSLQILNGDPFAELLLVSGGGSSHKLTPVGSGSDTIFAKSHAGFMALEFLINGKVDVQVIESGSTRPRFSKRLSRKDLHRVEHLQQPVAKISPPH